MITELQASASAMLKLALDAASLRHQAIANNIANINSVNYVPLKVNFEEQLSFLRQALQRGSEASIKQELSQIKPFIEQDTTQVSTSPAVMLDMEMLKLAQNTIHYQTLLKALSKRGSIIAMAINEGRR